MISNSKISEIKNKCNDYLIQIKHDNDTSDAFLEYTKRLNAEEIQYCGAVFEILEAYHFGKISREKSKKRHDELIKKISLIRE